MLLSAGGAVVQKNEPTPALPRSICQIVIHQLPEMHLVVFDGHADSLPAGKGRRASLPNSMRPESYSGGLLYHRRENGLGGEGEVQSCCREVFENAQVDVGLCLQNVGARKDVVDEQNVHREVPEGVE